MRHLLFACFSLFAPLGCADAAGDDAASSEASVVQRGIDTGFGTQGFATLPREGFADELTVVEEVDGKILVIGSSLRSSPPSLVRYTPDGRALDRSLGGSGMVRLEGLPKLAYCQVTAAALVGDGAIALLLRTSEGELVARVRADGTLDEAYGTGGVVRLADLVAAAPHKPPNAGHFRALLHEGEVFVGVYGDPNRLSPRPPPSPWNDVYFAKIDAHGAFDTKYGFANVVVRTNGVLPFFVDERGRVLVAAKERRVGIDPDEGDFDRRHGFVTRLEPGGAVDTTFGKGGTLVIADTMSTHDYEVYALDGTRMRAIAFDYGATALHASIPIELELGDDGKLLSSRIASCPSGAKVVRWADGSRLCASATRDGDLTATHWGANGQTIVSEGRIDTPSRLAMVKSVRATRENAILVASTGPFGSPSLLARLR